MRWLREFLFRLQPLYRRRRIERDLADEIRAHLQMATEAKIAEGLPPEEAGYTAQRQFGGVDQVKETYRDVRGFAGVEQVLRDLRLASRSLRKNPGFTAVAALTVALGIGVNTTTFSFVNAVVLRPVPYPDPDTLVTIYRTSPRALSHGTFSPAEILDLKTQNQVFAKFAIVDLPSFSLAVPGQAAERVEACAVSGDFFALLDVPPLHGRVFGPEADQPGLNNVIVLSYRFWQRRFGGDPGVVGRTLRLDGEPVTVIGIMPERFDDPMLWGSREIWKPLGMKPAVAKVRDGYWLRAVARLKADRSITEARANLDIIAARLSHEFPLTNAGCGFDLVRFGQENSWGFFEMLIGLALAVLLIASANLANLQLARSSSHAREYAIRIALGASRFQVMQQALTESLLLALIGGACGVCAAWGTNRLLSSRLADLMGDTNLEISIDARVLAFSLVAALATGLLFGIAPAWFSSRVDATSGLKRAGSGMSGDRPRLRLRKTLIVVEISLTLVLLSAAGYFVHGFQMMMQRETGWRTDHLLSGRLALTSSRYGDPDKCREFYDHLTAEVAALPGVERAIVCDVLPLGGFFNSRPVVAESAVPEAAGQESLAYLNTATPGYFDTLSMKLLQGRDFTAADRPGAPAVVIIDEALARKFWPNESPLGKRIGGPDPSHRDWLEVVGVVNEVKFKFDSDPQTHLQIYRPIAQTGGSYFAVVARTSVAPETLAEPLRRAVFRVDPDLAISDVSSADQMLENVMSGGSTLASGLLVMAISGVLLSALGLFGVIAHLVVERTKEIGIRVALGAQLGEVVWLVLGQGVRLATVGVLIGLAGAWAMARLLRGFLGMSGQDPLVLAGSCLLLVGVTLVACWVPARRAARVDPITALRTE